MDNFTDNWVKIIKADKEHEREFGHSCFERTDDTHDCPICGKKFHRSDMQFTHDCHGIPFRLVCLDCYDKIMDEQGYDGEYYTEADECIDADY